MESESWSKSNWVFMDKTLKDAKSSELKFERDQQESVVSEKLYLPNSGFGIDMQFKKIDGLWYLTSYEYTNM